MGDVYDRVIEISQEAYLRELCSLVSENYEWFPENDFCQNYCIIILTPTQNVDDDENEDQWSGKINQLKKHVASQTKSIRDEQKLLSKKFAQMMTK